MCSWFWSKAYFVLFCFFTIREIKEKNTNYLWISSHAAKWVMKFFCFWDCTPGMCPAFSIVLGIWTLTVLLSMLKLENNLGDSSYLLCCWPRVSGFCCYTVYLRLYGLEASEWFSCPCLLCCYRNVEMTAVHHHIRLLSGVKDWIQFVRLACAARYFTEPSAWHIFYHLNWWCNCLWQLI